MKPTEVSSQQSAVSSSVLIAAILPFWRYAVCPSRSDLAGIPYYRLAEAEKFFSETVKVLPWFDCTIYKRTWKGLVVIKQYRGTREF